MVASASRLTTSENVRRRSGHGSTWKSALTAGVVLLAAGAISVHTVLAWANKDIQFAERELEGIRSLRPLVDLLVAMPEYLELDAQGPTAEAAPRLAELDHRIWDSLTQLAVAHRRLEGASGGERLRQHPAQSPDSVRYQWQALAASWRTLPAPTRTEQHARLVESLQRLIGYTGDTFNLILDPDLDSYYVMDIALLTVPDVLSRLAMVGEAVVRREPVSRDRFVELAALLKAAGIEHVPAAIRSATAEDAAYYGVSTTLQLRLPPAGSAVVAAIEPLLTTLLDSHHSAAADQTRLATTTNARRATARLWTVAAEELEALLLIRRASYAQRRVLSLVGTTLAMLLSSAVVVALVRQKARIEGQRHSLQANEARTRAVTENALDAVVAMDAHGLITEWNTQAEDVFGWSRAEVIGRRLGETIVPLELRDLHERGLRRFLETGERRVLGRRIEITARRRTGEDFPVELTITPIADGATWSFSAFIRDITQRKRDDEALRLAKDAAEAASGAKSDFLATMSHELRTPLNAIIGYAEMLEEQAIEEHRHEDRQDLGQVLGAARHLLTLINTVLDFSKVDAQQLTLEWASHSATAIVDTAQSLAAPLAQRQGNTLVVENHLGDAFVWVDGFRLQQCLLNLLGNSCKFTQDGVIRLTVRRETRAGGEGTAWAVADTGEGIAAEDLSKLFVPFSQVDSTSSRRHSGTGLGLALTAQLCEMMGGAIGVESTLGQGATFTMWLPTRTSASSPAQPQAAMCLATRA
jgi:PAS domain S-box-containing protein